MQGQAEGAWEARDKYMQEEDKKKEGEANASPSFFYGGAAGN